MGTHRTFIAASDIRLRSRTKAKKMAKNRAMRFLRLQPHRQHVRHLPGMRNGMLNREHSMTKPRRRIRRFLNRLALTVSGLLTVATGLAWVDSHRERTPSITMGENITRHREWQSPQELHRELSGWRWIHFMPIDLPDGSGGKFLSVWRGRSAGIGRGACR